MGTVAASRLAARRLRRGSARSRTPSVATPSSRIRAGTRRAETRARSGCPMGTAARRQAHARSSRARKRTAGPRWAATCRWRPIRARPDGPPTADALPTKAEARRALVTREAARRLHVAEVRARCSSSPWRRSERSGASGDRCCGSDDLRRRRTRTSARLASIRRCHCAANQAPPTWMKCWTRPLPIVRLPEAAFVTVTLPLEAFATQTCVPS